MNDICWLVCLFDLGFMPFGCLAFPVVPKAPGYYIVLEQIEFTEATVNKNIDWTMKKLPS
jgi:hypothetical protein